MRADEFFDLSMTAHAALFTADEHVWQAVARIGGYIRARFATDLRPCHAGADVHPAAFIGDEVFIGPRTRVAPGALIEGPALIGADCEIRHGALLRANTVLADGAIVGHASETKNALLLEGAAAPHFAYVGDSILGQRVNLGAGTKLANVPLTSRPVTGAPRRRIMLRIDGREIDSGLEKLGAILGDDVELGCNCVISPGALVGPRTLVYALSLLPKGCYPPDSIVKTRQTQVIVRRRDDAGTT